MTAKERYQKGKEAARQEAVQWQLDFSNRPQSWGDLAAAGAHFEALGKKYGLSQEFRENGII